MVFSPIVWIFLAALASLSFCFPSKQQEPLQETQRSPFTPDFEENVVHLLSQWHVPGMSIAIVDGKETYSKGYGLSSFPSTNVTPSTLFYTGSTTKAFTAAALALLIDDSANSTSPLTWRTPISSLIREDFVLSDEYTTLHATLEDAASHRTGMPGHDASYGSTSIGGPSLGLRDIVRGLRNLPLTAEIRTRFQYCNMMYITLSHVLETLASSWLGDIFRTRIWDPLNMTRTYFSLAQAQRAVENHVAELAQGYTWNNLTEKYIQIPWMEAPFVSGAGNIISNVEDYAHWLHFLIGLSPPLSKMGHMSLRHGRIVKEDNPLPGFTGPSTYALGWNVETYRGETLISHTGGVPGFSAIVGYLPHKKYGITMMSNTVETGSIVQLILFFRLLDDYLGIEEKDRGDVVPVVESLIFEPKRKQLAHPTESLYPDAPTGSDVIPLSLPLEKYTGIYHNAGYRNLTITLSPPSPSSSTPEAGKHLRSLITGIMPFRFTFEHVSGEFFLIIGQPDIPGMEGIDTTAPWQILLLKAEFRIGQDGEVAEVGVDMEPQMGGEKIWFDRVGDVE
ncbi:MAG: hypothetical protein Q9219_002293 [cf. Caloplaca sp. 3 TL-2023]